MSSPQRRAHAASPRYDAPPSERIIDVRSNGPAILGSSSSRYTTDDEAIAEDDDSLESDAFEDAADDEHGSRLTELEISSEHEYHRGRHAVPMQSPGDELDFDLSDSNATGRRRSRSRLSAPRKKRQFFEGDELPSRSYARAGSRGHILQRIAFRRRKRGEDDTFWTVILISNVLSLALMCVLVIYLTQTDFFESHQNDLFGTTVDDRFTVVSPESADAKIYMKTGYSSSRFSEAMIAFGNGELKVGRRALSPTDAQPFYGMTLSSNGNATFTNKVQAPFIKSGYVYATRALVFADGSAMTTAANLTGGMNDVGDVNVVSKTGSITMSAGGKRILVVDPDATVNILNNKAKDPEGQGVTVDAVRGDISIAETFRLHHDQKSTVISSRNPIQFNSSRLVVGAVNASKVSLTCPPPSDGDLAKKLWAYKPMVFAIMGQSSTTQSRGGNVEISGGDGLSSGGDVLIRRGVSTDSDDDNNGRQGSVLINARLDRDDQSVTEIGSHGALHQVNLHGSVTINNSTDSGHATSLFIGGGSVFMQSTNVTIDNAAASSNASSVNVKSSVVSLEVGSRASLSAQLTLHRSGTIELNATRSIKLGTKAANASTAFFGKVQFGSDAGEDGSAGSSVADLSVDDGVVAIDADTLAIGGAGVTEVVSVKANRIYLGNTGMKSNVTIAGDHARVSSNRIRIGTSASRVNVSGHAVAVEADASIRISSGNSSTVSLGGGSVSVSGDKVRIGGAASSSVEIGASSTITIGSSVKSVAIGHKATAITIGSTDSAVEIVGKVTVNGHALDNRRRLEPQHEALYGIAETTQVAELVPFARSEFQIPMKYAFSSSEDFVSVVDSSLALSSASLLSTVKHLRMGLSLDSMRLSVGSGSSIEATPPRLRCRVYKAGTIALELVSQIDTCSSDADCNAGFFLSASTQRLVPAQPGDRFSIRCAVSTTQAAAAAATLLIGRVQLDVSSSL